MDFMRSWFFVFILSCAALQVGAVEYSVATHAGKRMTVCKVNLKQERIQLLHRDEKGQAFKKFQNVVKWLELRSQKLVFGMNGGMYHGDFSAVGLFVADGREVSPLNLAEGYGNFFLKPNGVFAITSAGARVVESAEYPKLTERIELATQSGPLLVRRGVLHPAFNENSKSRLLRNGVGVLSREVVFFVISEDAVNFFEFATFFRDGLHCEDALFLDGTVSSLHAAAFKRSDFRMDLGPILAITE